MSQNDTDSSSDLKQGDISLLISILIESQHLLECSAQFQRAKINHFKEYGISENPFRQVAKESISRLLSCNFLNLINSTLEKSLASRIFLLVKDKSIIQNSVFFLPCKNIKYVQIGE